jgi:hypothetical protein
MANTFRLIGRISPSHSLAVDSLDTKLHGQSPMDSVLLRAFPTGPLAKTERVLITGAAYPDEGSAAQGGQRVLDALRRTFARMRMGVTLGGTWDRQDELQIIPLPPPPFAYGFPSRLTVGRNPGRVERFFQESLAQGLDMNDAERLAYDLFALSWFAESRRVRLLLLVMAVEAVVQQDDALAEICDCVDRFMQQAAEAESLTADQRRDLRSRLGWLKKESIAEAGARLVQTELAGFTYSGVPAPKLFTTVYKLRNRLVHGHVPPPTEQDVSGVTGDLISMAADLLAGRLRDLDA